MKVHQIVDAKGQLHRFQEGICPDLDVLLGMWQEHWAAQQDRTAALERRLAVREDEWQRAYTKLAQEHQTLQNQRNDEFMSHTRLVETFAAEIGGVKREKERLQIENKIIRASASRRQKKKKPVSSITYLDRSGVSRTWNASRRVESPETHLL